MNAEYERREYTVQVDLTPKGQVVREVWTNSDGKVDRLGDLPAVQEFSSESGRLTAAYWFCGGIAHRSADKPAEIVICEETGVYLVERYLVDGVDHRSGDKPALILRASNNQIELRQFTRDGQLHRDSGPAVERFDAKTGAVLEREFWSYGDLVRRDQSGRAPTPGP